jgi:hypothetical protein
MELLANSIVDDAMYRNARKAALSADKPRQSPTGAARPTLFTGAAIPLDAATR